MKLFHNFVTSFNLFWVICGEITYASNIYEIDAAIINLKFLVKTILVNFEICRIWSLAQY